jgi:DnaJ-class molecular chaperone
MKVIVMFDFDPQKNYYDILGVSETATDDEIKKAFRKQAMQHHPDKWGDQEEFKKINEAYQVIGDTEKKQQYDTVRKGWYGGGFWWQWGFGGFGWGGGFGWFGDNVQFQFGGGDINDIFGDLIGGMFGWGGYSNRPRKGDDVELQLNISFEQAYAWLEKDITYQKVTQIDQQSRKMIQSNDTVQLSVPAGIASGQYLKFGEKGHIGRNGWPAGDLYVKIYVKPSSQYERQWDDIVATVDVSIVDLVLGTEVDVPHPDTKMSVKIPKGTQVTDIVKVAGKWFPKLGNGWVFGHKHGDLLVKLRVSVPKKLSKEHEKLWKWLQGE